MDRTQQNHEYIPGAGTPEYLKEVREYFDPQTLNSQHKTGVNLSETINSFFVPICKAITQKSELLTRVEIYQMRSNFIQPVVYPLPFIPKITVNY